MADTQIESMKKVSQTIIDKGVCGGGAAAQPLLVPCDVTNPQQVVSLISKADEYAADLSTSSLSSSSLQSTIFPPNDGEDKSDEDDDTFLHQPPKSATILVNCAGITKDNFTSKMTMTEFDDVIDVNLRGTFLTCRAFVDAQRIELSPVFSSLISKDSKKEIEESSSSGDKDDPTSIDATTGSSSTTSLGSIINIASIVGEQGNIGQVNYAASKAGVIGLTKSLAKETASRNKIRVNAVLPGFIATPMTQKVPQHILDNILASNRIPMQRMGSPNDVANLVCFLASCKRSSYITGASVPVSGMISL